MTAAVRIDGIELAELRFTMKRVAANAKHQWVAREGVLVTVRAGGQIGRGEASPLPGFSPESLADAVRDLERAKDALSGAALSLDGAPLDALEAALPRTLAIAAPSARFALETALLDARARLLGMPLWRDLARGRDVAPVAISALLAGDGDDAIARSVDEAIARGLGTGKLKVGRTGALARELAWTQMIRARAGDAFRLRLDANGAWTTDEARAALDAFASVDPELLEEPVSGERWLALPARKIRVAIDESAAGPDGPRLFEEVLARGLCDAVVVKLSAVGGLVAADRMVRRSEAAGRPVILTHMFEGAVGTAAAAAFAIARGSRAHAAGMDVRGYLDLPADHPIGSTAIEPGTGAGLGLDEPLRT